MIRSFLVCCTCFILSACSSSSNSGGLNSQKENNAIEEQRLLNINRKHEGVIVTDSGLQYSILEKSNGCKPDPDYKVAVHYKMLSVNSKKIIDSSYQRRKPSKFYLSKTIKGWREGVSMMNVGETWLFYIPSNLAYGTRGLSGTVAPNSLLISEVSLIDARCLS